MFASASSSSSRPRDVGLGGLNKLEANPDTRQELHQTLKRIKRGIIQLNDDSGMRMNISWSEEKQCFHPAQLRLHDPKNVFRNQQSDAIYLASGYFFKGLTYPLGMPQPFKNQPETNFLRQFADF